MAKSPAIPNRYGRRVCIFCCGTPITEEHIFAQWAEDLLPKSPGHVRFALQGRRTSRTMETLKHYQRQGNVSSIRVKCVCGPCNSGWMSGYETAVRPVLTDMILGRRRFINEAELKTLLEYLVLKLLVIDQFENGPVFTTRQESEAFYQTREIPKFTAIRLFNCVEGTWRNALRVCGVGLGSLEDFVDDPDGTPNTKSFAVGIGNLFVFAVLSTSIQLNINPPPGDSFLLWPPHSPTMRWPPLRGINSVHAERLANNLFEFVDKGPVLRAD